MAKCESQLHVIKGAKLPMAYRWLESVVNAMRGGARDAVAYAPNCYSKLLLLGPSAGPMLPERRAVPNGLPRRGPSRLYARDPQGAAGCSPPPSSARPASTPTRVMAQPESHYLEWGEIVPDPPLIDAFGYQQGRGGRPGAAGVGVGGGGTDGGAGGRPAAPGTTQARRPAATTTAVPTSGGGEAAAVPAAEAVRDLRDGADAQDRAGALPLPRARVLL